MTEWIDHDSGECPVDPDQMVEIERRCGGKSVRRAKFFAWASDLQMTCDIVRYRLIDVKPEVKPGDRITWGLGGSSWVVKSVEGDYFLIDGASGIKDGGKEPCGSRASFHIRRGGLYNLRVIEPAKTEPNVKTGDRITWGDGGGSWVVKCIDGGSFLIDGNSGECMKTGLPWFPGSADFLVSAGDWDIKIFEPAESEQGMQPRTFQAGDRVVIKGLGVKAVIEEVVLIQELDGSCRLSGYLLGGGVSPVMVQADQIEGVE